MLLHGYVNIFNLRDSLKYNKYQISMLYLSKMWILL